MKYKIHQGDALTVLKTMPDESVQTCITSPPYWGLRDYGTSIWDGGDQKCDHIKPSGTILGNRSDTFHGSNTQVAHKIKYKDICAKCGAKRIDSQLGLESTPEEFVANMVEVFREVKRVLRNDGTVWLNLGDSYAQASSRAGQSNSDHEYKHTNEKFRDKRYSGGVNIKAPPGLKPKDLCGIPWRVAFALQADGWYLRSEIIWAKPNPMPESVTDRPTKSHETIFLLTKKAKYYYDADAIREPVSNNTHNQISKAEIKRISEDRAAGANTTIGKGKTPKSVKPDGMIKQNDSFTNAVCLPVSNRNKRTVWTVPTQPMPQAHFATYPEKLIKPCVLAGCPQDGVVLDPFMGAATTGVVALENNRQFIGIELNQKYITEIAEPRLKNITFQRSLFN